MPSHHWALKLTIAFSTLIAGDHGVLGQDTVVPINSETTLQEGWEQIDTRLVFLTVRLASVEASLEAIEGALGGNARKQAGKLSEAKRAEANNSLMDRKGGGPVKWSEFYGRTAENFFYHPIDRNSTYHTITVLRQSPNTRENQTRAGAPSSQGLPVNQRPPQFDYIYRANRDAKAAAEREAAELRSKAEALQARRRQLEEEQSALWCEIALRAIDHYDLNRKPFYRFEPKVAVGAQDHHAISVEAIKAMATFMRTVLDVVSDMQIDQLQTFSAIKKTISDARDRLADAWSEQAISLDDPNSATGRFAALAKHLEEVAGNLADSYSVSIDGDRFKDERRKELFRGLLQESLISFAQSVLALDEMSAILAREWKFTPDRSKPIKAAMLESDVGPLKPTVNQKIDIQAHASWVGLGLHTKGPGSTVQEFQRLELQFDHWNGDNFEATYFWKDSIEKEDGQGNHKVVGSLNTEKLKWTSKLPDGAASGRMCSGFLIVTWGWDPYYGENYYVPAVVATASSRPFIGAYQIMEMDKSVKLELLPNGTARKSSAGDMQGAWIASGTMAIVVWPNGSRDVLRHEEGKITNRKLARGSVVTDEMNPSDRASKID